MGDVALAMSVVLVLTMWLAGAFAAARFALAFRRHSRSRELTRSENRQLAMRIFLLNATDPETAGLESSYRRFLILLVAFSGCVVLVMVVAATVG